MDRTEYIKTCQKVSMFLPKKLKIPEDLFVKYGDNSYVPYAYKMIFKSGEPKNVAVLCDFKSNSITNVDLAKVSKEVE